MIYITLKVETIDFMNSIFLCHVQNHIINYYDKNIV